jgi:hypothetical protein
MKKKQKKVIEVIFKKISIIFLKRRTLVRSNEIKNRAKRGDLKVMKVMKVMKIFSNYLVFFLVFFFSFLYAKRWGFYIFNVKKPQGGIGRSYRTPIPANQGANIFYMKI